MMNFEQVSTIINDIYQQMTGRIAAKPTDTREFVSVATTVLNLDTDRVINTLYSMIGRTIFSERAYNGKLDFVYRRGPAWGGFIRKLAIVDSDFSDDPAYEWPVLYDATETNNPLGNGESVDPWKICKREVLQVFFSGQSVYKDCFSLFEDQMTTAFRSPEEFGSFAELLMMNANNKLAQSRESVARGLILNLIGSIIAENKAERNVHLVTEYNAASGLSLTSTTVMQPDNWIPFVEWAYARIMEISDIMEERSTMYQTVILNKPVVRHTPKDRQNLLLHSMFETQVSQLVRANIRNNNYLTLPAARIRYMPYWQSIKDGSRTAINVQPVYTSNGGIVTRAANAVTAANVVGLLYDDDAIAATQLDDRTLVTPLNPAGLYRTYWTHCKNRVAQDNTEKAVVLLLD